MDEQKIDKLWKQIKKEKTASVKEEDIDVDDFVAELEKNASKIDNVVSGLDKTANKEDVDKINEQGVGGKMLVESNDETKQRLKEIAMNGLKNGVRNEQYDKLRKKLLSQNNNEEMVEELSDKIASQILDGEL